jgi:hypothetical protein
MTETLFSVHLSKIESPLELEQEVFVSVLHNGDKIWSTPKFLLTGTGMLPAEDSQSTLRFDKGTMFVKVSLTSSTDILTFVLKTVLNEDKEICVWTMNLADFDASQKSYVLPCSVCADNGPKLHVRLVSTLALPTSFTNSLDPRLDLRAGPNFLRLSCRPPLLVQSSLFQKLWGFKERLWLPPLSYLLPLPSLSPPLTPWSFPCSGPLADWWKPLLIFFFRWSWSKRICLL